MSRIAIAFLALTLLAGCGIKNGLQRPDPMWGAERQRVEAEHRAAEEERRAQEDPGDSTGTTPSGSGESVLPPR